MYLHIILESGRTMNGGYTESVTEVSEVMMNKISNRGLVDENAIPTITWLEPSQTDFMRQPRCMPLHEGDMAIVKSNGGDTLCTYKGDDSPKHKKDRLEEREAAIASLSRD